MIRGFDIHPVRVKNENTNEFMTYYRAILYYAMVSDDPWSTFCHSTCFPTYELAKAFLAYIVTVPGGVNLKHWILQDADSKAEPFRQAVKPELVLFNVPF